jgi:predicted PurR-regulated permease PerM
MAQKLAADLTNGTLSIPAPSQSIGGWPIIGEPLERFWRLASENLGAALAEIRPQIATFGSWLLATVAKLGLGVLQFVLAIIIAGVFLANAHGGGQTAREIATRLAGERGADYAELGQATVRSVARGILGVALIQSLLAGLGFLAVSIPGAGLLALVCLFLAVVQIGAVVYVFSTADTFTAVIFLIWSIFVGLIDNVLKPVLLGRGVKVPMVVIFAGAIGGFLASDHWPFRRLCCPGAQLHAVQGVACRIAAAYQGAKRLHLFRHSLGLQKAFCQPVLEIFRSLNGVGHTSIIVGCIDYLVRVSW